jgi:hypothetical protein
MVSGLQHAASQLSLSSQSHSIDRAAYPPGYSALVVGADGVEAAGAGGLLGALSLGVDGVFASVEALVKLASAVDGLVFAA